MKVTVESNFSFSVSSIQYTPGGELRITLFSDTPSSDNHYQYSAMLGDGQADEKPSVSLLKYSMDYASSAMIKAKTRESYRLMCRHLKTYGDMAIDEVTTSYLEGFIAYLQDCGLKAGSVRLYFQKLACVLHDAYRNGLFDDRIIQRVRRPRREQEKKTFLTEGELRRMVRHSLPEEYGNIRDMFLFSCMTGLRFGDVLGLRWSDVKRRGRHLQLEFLQQKTGTHERLSLCEEAETLLSGRRSRRGHVFGKENNQRVNKVLRHWCQSAGIRKPVTFHSARHTFCVMLLTKDVPIYTVQRLMCHTDIGSTKVYADILARTECRALRRLPLLLT